MYLTWKKYVTFKTCTSILKSQMKPYFSFNLKVNRPVRGQMLAQPVFLSIFYAFHILTVVQNQLRAFTKKNDVISNTEQSRVSKGYVWFASCLNKGAVAPTTRRTAHGQTMSFVPKEHKTQMHCPLKAGESNPGPAETISLRRHTC